ncbi:hypothetical protein HCU77_19130 [Streptomyces coelicolor]|uniref:isocitrate/isopropylmalate family dehydrogenase n=1 Tax=Streptomyces coelicolor TaxID=1902 RepID=UPI00156DC533|nr:hypothetical protein [Streptomyces coelicolor]QKN67423.1 hypothetical protein HCU77_19130 [Streptomyces coelicolor]
MSAPKKIVVLPGDHVGQEITAEAIKVLKAISDVRSNVKFDFENHLIGGAAIDLQGGGGKPRCVSKSLMLHCTR